MMRKKREKILKVYTNHLMLLLNGTLLNFKYVTSQLNSQKKSTNNIKSKIQNLEKKIDEIENIPS